MISTRALRRFGVMLGGEVAQSLFHFGLNIVLVRLLPARDYGIFAFVLLLGGLALTYVRSLCGMPANLYVPLRAPRRGAYAYDVTFGSGAVVLAGVIVVVAAGVLHVWFHTPAAAASAFVGLWSLRSYVRSSLFAKRQPVLAGASDLAFVVSGFALALVLLHGSPDQLLDRAFDALSAANCIALLVAFALQRRRVRISFGPRMRQRYQGLSRQLSWSVLGVTTANVQAQGQVFLIALVAGPAAYAPVAAMLMFFAPLRLAAAALANMMQPELARMVAAGQGAQIRRVAMTWTLVMAGVAALAGAGVAVGVALVPIAVFAGQPRLVIGILAWIISTMPLLYVVPRVLLEVRRAFRLITVMAAASALVGLTVGGVLLVVSTPIWSLVGIAISEIIVAVWCWAEVFRWQPVQDGPAAVARHVAAPVHASDRRLVPVLQDQRSRP